jgi:hypothetical protein
MMGDEVDEGDRRMNLIMKKWENVAEFLITFLITEH